MPSFLPATHHKLKLPDYGFNVVLSIPLRMRGHITVGNGLLPCGCTAAQLLRHTWTQYGCSCVLAGAQAGLEAD